MDKDENRKKAQSLRDEIRTLESEREAIQKVIDIGYFSEDKDVTSKLKSAVSAYDDAIQRDVECYADIIARLIGC